MTLDRRTILISASALVLAIVVFAAGVLFRSRPPEHYEHYGSDTAANEEARVAAAWEARLQKARDLSANVSLNDDKISCSLTRIDALPAHAAGSAAADLMLTVAEQPLIVFVVGGLEYNTDDGWQSFDYLRTHLGDEIEVARSTTPASAVCLVRWGTLQGFGEDTSYLAKAVAAVRDLSEDPLLPAGETRRIVVTGYSAGGNFAAYAPDPSRAPRRQCRAPDRATPSDHGHAAPRQRAGSSRPGLGASESDGGGLRRQRRA